MKNQEKIAFIHHSRCPMDTRLETMPFSLNSVISLANMGWQVDLYLWEKPSENYKNLLPKNIDIKYFKEPISLLMRGIRPIWLKLQFQQFRNYSCVFGVGQIGAYIADIIAKANRCPFIYFNDEFPSLWKSKRWMLLEKKSVQNAAIVVVPDPHRFQPLCKELDISTKPHVFLPNMPLTKPILENINWHQKLGIPINTVPFLHAGNLALAGPHLPEILSSLPSWNAKAVLILHSNFWEGLAPYRTMVSNLGVSNKVIWSSEILSESELHSLVAYCAGNLAIYHNSQPNIEYLGFSSGKIMRSLICGSPVITLEGFYCSFIKDYQLGVLISHPSEITNAIEDIIQNREAYSKRCLDFCQKEVSFEKYWQIFCDQLKKEANVDLRKAVML